MFTWGHLLLLDKMTLTGVFVPILSSCCHLDSFPFPILNQSLSQYVSNELELLYFSVENVILSLINPYLVEC